MYTGSMSSSICYDCANVTANNCSWLKNGNKKDLIEYENRMIKSTSGKTNNIKYKEYVSVQKCKRFEKGPLKINRRSVEKDFAINF